MLAPERLSGSDNAVARAYARGRIRVSRREPGFLTVSKANKPPGREQLMAWYSGETYGPTEQPDSPPEPTDLSQVLTPTLRRDKPVSSPTAGSVGPTEYPTAQGTPSRGIGKRRREHELVLEDLLPPRDEKQAPETVVQHVEEIREKLTEATDEQLATDIIDPAFEAATRSWETETDLVTKLVDTSEQLKDGVVASLRSVGADSGLSPGAADFTAGVATNLILAPITGPLDKAETYIEVAGIIIGVTMGAHGLALACAKASVEASIRTCV